MATIKKLSGAAKTAHEKKVAAQKKGVAKKPTAAKPVIKAAPKAKVAPKKEVKKPVTQKAPVKKELIAIAVVGLKKIVDNISALHPVYSHRNQMAAFFGKDNDVTVEVVFDADNKASVPVFNVIVAGCDHKAEAMRILLNGDFVIGGVRCILLVNGKAKSHKSIVTPAIINAALTGNSLFSQLYIKYNDDKSIDKWSIQLKPEVVFFPNDQLNSPNGLECHSAEDLARIALGGKMNTAMMYSTDIGVDNGYWNQGEFGHK